MANKHFSLGEFRANQSSIAKLNENRIFKTFFQSVLFHECLLFLSLFFKVYFLWLNVIYNEIWIPKAGMKDQFVERQGRLRSQLATESCHSYVTVGYVQLYNKYRNTIKLNHRTMYWPTFSTATQRAWVYVCILCYE